MYYTIAEMQDIVRSEMRPTLWPAALMLTGNARAHRWQVTVFDNGQPIDLTGAKAIAKFRREVDDVTVVQTATVDVNMIWVILDPACYRYAGRLKAMLEITTGSGVDAITAPVKVTYFDVLAGGGDAVSDPENVIPSIGEIIAQMGAMVDATEDCNQATLLAQDAADDALDMAERAEDIAVALEGMTAGAQTLEAGAAATAAVSDVSGHKHITLGVPRGPQGVRGTLPWYGKAITGNSVTPTPYATGLAAVNAGDVYIYTGTDTANAGNEYTCTLGGDAATALWRYLRNSRGVPGAGNVSYVNGESPDGDGDVTLNAGDIPAGSGSTVQAELNAKTESEAHTATLPTSGWSGTGPYTYTANVAGVTADNVVLAGPAPASKAAYADCGAYVTAQGAGTLTFTADSVPTSQITVNIVIFNL